MTSGPISPYTCHKLGPYFHTCNFPFSKSFRVKYEWTLDFKTVNSHNAMHPDDSHSVKITTPISIINHSASSSVTEWFGITRFYLCSRRTHCYLHYHLLLCCWCIIKCIIIQDGPKKRGHRLIYLFILLKKYIWKKQSKWHYSWAERYMTLNTCPTLKHKNTLKNKNTNIPLQNNTTR